MLTALAVSGYRSLRDVVVPLAGLNLVTGANGSGKSNLYRALRLLADVAQGRAIASLAQEGGLNSVLWAGPEAAALSVRQGYHAVQGTRRKGPISLKLGFASDEFGYAIDLGLPAQEPTRDPSTADPFRHDPEIKREVVWSGTKLRPSAVLVDRRGPFVRSRVDGDWLMLTQGLSSFDSLMTHCADPKGTPEALVLRESIRGWRFYDHFRTDAASPARLPQIGTHTPVLGHDGRDLAAAIETIRMIGDGEALAAAIDDAFPGSQVSVRVSDGWFSVEMQQHGLLRPLGAGELSDGTLRYLLWIAALLTPRPPQLLVLNEPETSLHPDLLPALARLIVQAAKRSQVIVVSHAGGLIDALQSEPDCHAVVLRKDFGDTQVEGTRQPPRWEWPAR
jgi:predicted ATPase